MERVTVFGGSGFVGRYIVKRLAERGTIVRAAVRNPERALFLKPMGAVGQVAPVPGDVRSEQSVRAAVRDADAVINAVGFWDGSRNGFDSVHHAGAGRVARLSREAGVRRFVHLSGIGATESSPSGYVVARARGERAVRDAFGNAAILQPSVIFGQEDRFFNLIGRILKNAPVFPVIAGATKMQPVYVGDVAKAAVAALDLPQGGAFQLGGPRVYRHIELIDLAMTLCARRRPRIALPMGPLFLLAGLLDLLPVPTPLTRDTLALLRDDNVVEEDAPGFPDLGITPVAAEAIAPTYLDQYRPHGRFGRPKTA